MKDKVVSFMLFYNAKKITCVDDEEHMQRD